MNASPDSTDTFQPGLIEGFFGRPWSWQARYSYAGFLAEHQFSSYLYAPKSDRSLRQQWDQPFEPEHQAELTRLATHYQEHNLDFGIGLSPFELYLNFNSESRAALKAKIEAINTIAPTTLCILFDDMVGSVDKLASIQSDIMNFVMELSSAQHFIFCPTYYSEDPVLVKHFGKKPDNYLQQLGSLLPLEVDIFWTGPNVISSSYPANHLQHIGELLQRPPLIWDNYPVNDSKHLSKYLLLAPAIRDVPGLRKNTRGHMINPMNQAWLSQIPLLALSLQYQGENKSDTLFRRACEEVADNELATLLLEDMPAFQQQGLGSFDNECLQGFIDRYQTMAGNPLADEVLDWLNGGYNFDPACLT